MIRRMISLLTLLILTFSLMIPAIAFESASSDSQSQESIAEAENDPETEDSVGEENSLAAANRITFTNWTLFSIGIPDSTSMLSKGVVSDGIITYEAKVRVQIKNNGRNYGNQTVSWKTTASASNAKIISKDSRTNASGIAYITFHVRGIEKLPVTITCANVSGSKTIDLGTKGSYNSTFRRTHYITSYEGDYNGEKISVAGLSSKYKRDFLTDVKEQGSGKGEDGKYIKYYNGYSYQAPTTATQTTPKVRQTIAVDPYYIPCVYRNGYKRGYVTIQGGIGQRIAEDTGSAIQGRHIDEYVGIGKSSRDSKDGYYSVLFNGVNSWGRNANNNSLLGSLDDVSENVIFVPMNPITCQSKDGVYTAYAGDADDSKVNSVTVSVTRNKNVRSNSDAADFDLATSVLSVESMEITDNMLVTIGNVNPSLQVYQKFNIDTHELIDEYYGYGFTNTDEGMFYVEAPQHFSGVVGLNRIMDDNGNVLYESGENIIIRGNLVLDGTTLSFMEFDTESGDYNSKSVSTTARLDAVSYYD